MKYEIQGETLPVVICQLADGERMITEGGAMSWMSPNMKMETTSNGGIGKAFGRAVSGEKLFQNVYTATNGNGMIAFASCFPGSIRAFEIAPGQEMILQKSAFWQAKSVLKCRYSSTKNWEPAFSVVKALSCRGSADREPYLQNLTDMSWSMNLHRDSRLL